MKPSYDLLRGILDQAKTLRERRQDGEAYRKLRQLLAFGEVPAEVREEAHVAVADLLMDAGKYRKARRSLVAALAIAPHKAETHFLMALAIDEDTDADPARAMAHLKVAVKANPEQPAYWIALGQVAQRMHRAAAARTAYRRALQLELESMDELEDVVVGLVESGRPREARAALMGSHFRFASPAAWLEVWHRFRFLALRRRQSREVPFEPVVLPFVAAAKTSGTVGEAVILRRDGRSRSLPHTVRLSRKHHPRRSS
jgi:tetratricopeptide (TPR) repeat protein